MVNRGVSSVSSKGISALMICETVGADVLVDTNTRTNALTDVDLLFISAHAITPSVVPFV